MTFEADSPKKMTWTPNPSEPKRFSICVLPLAVELFASYIALYRVNIYNSEELINVHLTTILYKKVLYRILEFTDDFFT